MHNKKSDELNGNIKEAVREEHRKHISTVWIVPIVALIVGALLLFQSINEKGPTIKIYFKSAEGVKAGKTVIKYKDIEVGKVTDVSFGKELKKVIVTAELKKNMKPFLSEKSRFWVMKARVAVGGVEGLDTLLSGVYIVMDPQKGTQKVTTFEGLVDAPVVTAGDKGKVFELIAEDISSIGVGLPIYYKKIDAGRVISYSLNPDGKNVKIKIFIKEPFSKMITDKTRFWNASGITANINADGIEVHTESIASILAGGLAFENFNTHGQGKEVPEGHTFKLYPTLKKAKTVEYHRELYFWVYFNDSIRGLSIGAPVEFRGVKIGEVVDFSLVGDSDTAKFEIPILIKIQPERFTIIGEKQGHGNQVNTKILRKLLDQGFRAQLQNGNLLTGELIIDLGLYPDMPKVTSLRKEKGYYVIPSIPATMETLKSDIKTVLDRIAAIPFEEIGTEMNALLKDVRKDTVPRLNKSISSMDKTVVDTDRMINAARKNYVDSNAQINKKLIKLLDEMTQTSRSIKNLTDYLERHPESLIKGK